MRKISILKKNRSFKFILHKLLDIFLKVLPSIFFKKILEHRFINFGMEITNICNANCTFCAYRYQQKKKGVIDTDNYKRLIDEYSKVGGGPMTYTPTVGDPLVDPDIIEKIKYGRSKSNISSILLYTNGILLNKFGFKNVLNSGIDRLAISTYVGSKEGYLKYYQKDQYETVVNNIIEISKINKELNNPVLITLHLRVESNPSIWKNSSEYLKIIEFMDEKDIQYLTTYDTWGGKIKKEDLPEGCEVDVPISLDQKIKKGPCFELFRRVHVLPDLNVGACICVDLENEINIGNLKENNLKDIWKGDKIKSFRSNWKKGILPEVCKQCTRYEPVEYFIDKNRASIFKEPIKRAIKKII
jgi:radical SAM protein with 4Fe4S-binding SPASM domain